MITDEYRRRLLEEQSKFESGKKEQELEILRVRLQRNRFLIFGLLGGVILILFIAGMFLLQARLKARQRMEDMNHRISELTQKNLRQQMNPHFIFNTLNSIQYYVFKNDKISSNNYMTKFAKLIRMTLENSRFTSIPIKEEIEALNLYLELESLRFKGKFDWEINVDEEIDTLLYKIPTMLIQPFVENSIGHGLMHKEGKGHIAVDLKLEDEVIVCTIEDNGIGREKAMEIKRQKEENHNSLGTTITESRIKLVNALYGQNMKVIYTDLKDDEGKAAGTRVQITVPVMG
jgi:LytS/YehU family sensor histidine kinase